MAAAQLHRRGAEAVAREDAGDGRAGCDLDHREIAPVRLAHPGHGDAQAHADHRVQVLRVRGLQIDGHGSGSVRGKAEIVETAREVAATW